jgi:sugar porter (SP) family MFS transporter
VPTSVLALVVKLTWAESSSFIIISSSSMHSFAKATETSDSTRMLQLNVAGLSLVFVTPMLGGFLYGFDIGATSFVLAMLLNPSPMQVSSSVWWIRFSSLQQGLFVSGLSLGGLIGSHLVLMYLSHKIGRRMELRLSAIFYIVGTLFNVMSGTLLKDSHALGFLCLFAGRIFYGIGVGFLMHGAPAYLAEMCPAEIRGAVVSAKETVIVSGIVLGYAVGNFISDDPSNWTWLYVLTGLAAVPMFVLTFFIPRSKRWLLLHGLDDEAYQSIKFVYKGEIREEFDRLALSVRSGNIPKTSKLHAIEGYEVKHAVSSPSVTDPRYRKAIVASMGLILFQQFSGQPSVLSYATVLFQAAGWSGNASVVSSILMLITSMSAVLFIERLGRKVLLSASCIVMMVALSALCTAFWGWDNQVGIESGPTQMYIILVSMFLYIGGYQLGFGPITWCIVSEIFPIEIRGTAMALAVELNYALNFIVQFGFPILQSHLGWGPSFSVFGIILAFAYFYIQAFVPETTGLTLEEIQLQLSSSDDPHNRHKAFSESGGRPYEGTHLLSQISQQSQSRLIEGTFNVEEMEAQLRQTTSRCTPSEEEEES